MIILIVLYEIVKNTKIVPHRPVTEPKLTAQHCKERLQFIRQQVN